MSSFELCKTAVTVKLDSYPLKLYKTLSKTIQAVRTGGITEIHVIVLTMTIFVCGNRKHFTLLGTLWCILIVEHSAGFATSDVALTGALQKTINCVMFVRYWSKLRQEQVTGNRWCLNEFIFQSRSTCLLEERIKNLCCLRYFNGP